MCNFRQRRFFAHARVKVLNEFPQLHSALLVPIKEILDKHAKTEDGKSWQDLRREGTIHVTQDPNRGTYHWVSKEYVEDLKA